jgi:hypothetical protein
MRTFVERKIVSDESLGSGSRRHTPGAKAPHLWSSVYAKAKALAYLEAKAKARSKDTSWKQRHKLEATTKARSKGKS